MTVQEVKVYDLPGLTPEEPAEEESLWNGMVLKVYDEKKRPDLKFGSHCVDRQRFQVGKVDVTERLDFPAMPVKPEATDKIIRYYAKLMKLAVWEAQEAADREDPEQSEPAFTLEATLTLKGKNGYETSTPEGFIYGLLFDLEDAEGFTITAKRSGYPVSPWFEQEMELDWSELAEAIGTDETFTYKVFMRQNVSNEGSVLKFENGRWVDHTTLYSDAILDDDTSKEWDSNALNLGVSFDTEKHKDVFEAMCNAARRYLPDCEIKFMEKAWENWYYHIEEKAFFLMDMSWADCTLRQLQDLSDELNRIIEPIKGECTDIGCDGYLFRCGDPVYAVAEWKYTPERGFFAEGVIL